MRPRFMNRGSQRVAGTWQAGRQCFNEAPIHESGKSRHRCRRRGRTARFNEAPIHESGKFRDTAAAIGILGKLQ